jgi:phosphoribosylanthranilate isomerase
MQNNIKIKICGMRESENIKAVAELQPDYLGLIFYPKSKRFVEDYSAPEIIDNIPRSIKKVGVFVNEDISEVKKKVKLFSLDTIQLHGNESPFYCKELKDSGIEVIKAFGVNDSFDFLQTESYESSCDFFLFDTKSEKYGGTGIKFNWEKLSEYNNAKPVFLSGGLGPKDAEKVLNIKDFNLYCVDLNSKFEIEPALKDIDLLNEFITEFRKK